MYRRYWDFINDENEDILDIFVKIILICKDFLQIEIFWTKGKSVQDDNQNQNLRLKFQD